MKLTLKTLDQNLVKTDLLIVPARENARLKLPAGLKVPGQATQSFEGKPREMRLTDAISGAAARVLFIGLGSGKTVSETLRRCGALAAKKAGKIEAKSATVWIEQTTGKAAEDLGQAVAEGIVMGSYRLSDFKSKSEPTSLKRIAIHATKEFNAGVKRGQIIGEANCMARRLQDTPANLMRPCDLVSEARKIASGNELVTSRIIDEKAMAKFGMGSLLSVSRGSSEPAYLIHLTYKPEKKASKKLCLVGKGLTFDAGGISLKPSAKMDEMKYDMSGGAAVLGAMAAIAELKPDIEVHGLVPASENLPDGKANKPGDLVTAMNGLTIEILNTDAEGRLILADALVYAGEKIKPDAMVDLATLTGAVLHALGHEYSGAMGNNESLIQEFVKSGRRTGELVWPLPIHEKHSDSMKGKVGDLKNISGPGIGAGSSTGGAFLKNFVGDIPWVHLDIAGSAWGVADRDYQNGVTGTGVGVRLLVDWIEQNI